MSEADQLRAILAQTLSAWDLIRESLYSGVPEDVLTIVNACIGQTREALDGVHQPDQPTA